MILYYFIFFYIVAILIENSDRKTKLTVCFLSCLVLALMAGNRDIYSWADTFVYYSGFLYHTNNLFSFSFSDEPYGYVEKGFYFIGVLTKTFTTNATVYLIIVSLISFFFLYKCLKRYCVYPLLGLSVYISRFLIARHFVQIRAGLAYVIVIWAIQYVTKRDWKKFFGFILIAYLFHRSSLIAVPLYFLGMVSVKKWHIVLGMVLAFICGGFLQNEMHSFIVDNASDIYIKSYTVGVEVVKAQGLYNPLIYFQTILLFVYTFGEKKLRNTSIHYYTIRNGYFISCFLLTAFSMFLGLSGRTSTLFATLEIIILPSIVFLMNKKNRIIAFVCVGVVLTALFYMKYQNLM